MKIGQTFCYGPVKICTDTDWPMKICTDTAKPQGSYHRREPFCWQMLTVEHNFNELCIYISLFRNLTVHIYRNIIFLFDFFIFIYVAVTILFYKNSPFLLIGIFCKTHICNKFFRKRTN